MVSSPIAGHPSPDIHYSSAITHRAVFLDRDGVINKAIVRDGKAFSPCSRDEFLIIPGSITPIKKLRECGFKIIVVTNQPDIVRGKLSLADLKWMTKRIITETEVDEVMVCPHDDTDSCICRKPKPGMLLEGANKWQIDLSISYMIGDGWKDMEAGKRAGCTCILVDAPYNKGVDCNLRVNSLEEGVEYILGIERRRTGAYFFRHRKDQRS